MVTMLVTRPEPDASETAGRLRAIGIAPLIEPLLRREALPARLPDAAGFAALAITSAAALRTLEERGELSRFLSLPVFAVGDRTAGLARQAGFGDVTSANGNLERLVERLAEAGVRGPILYPAAEERAGDLARSLAGHGIMVITTPIYGMRPVPALSEPATHGLTDGGIAAALFYSRRTAETFVRLTAGLDRRTRNTLGVLCLSTAVAEPLVDAHFVRVGLADAAREDAMLALALSFSREIDPA